MSEEQRPGEVREGGVRGVQRGVHYLACPRVKQAASVSLLAMQLLTIPLKVLFNN